MSAKKDPRPRRLALWRNNGQVYAMAGPALGVGASSVASIAADLGFRNGRGTKHTEILKGPCVECGQVYRPKELDHRYLCEACAVMEDMEEPETLSAVEQVKELHGVCLAYERREHRRRMEKRKDGRLPRLPDPVVFETSAGVPFGKRMLKDSHTR